MSQLLLDRAGRRRSPATLPGFQRRPGSEQQGAALPGGSAQGRRDRRRHARRRRSTARRPPTRSDRDPVAIRAAHPGRARAYRRRPRSTPRLAPGPTGQGRSPSRGWDGRMGLGTTRALAPRAMRATDRTTVLRHQWHDPRTPLVARRGTRGAPAYRRRGRSASPLRAASASPRPRRRDGPRGSAANRDPAPTRTQQPRHHERLPPRHRQRRDHRNRARATRTHDPSQRLAPALIARPSGRCSSREAKAPRRPRCSLSSVERGRLAAACIRESSESRSEANGVGSSSDPVAPATARVQRRG